MEDFEKIYEDELELMREMEDDTSDHPCSRRALQLSSPFLTPGSRKRPSENSPLPLLSLDCGGSPDSPGKTPHGPATPSTPLSARPKGDQSTLVNRRSNSVKSCERASRQQDVGSKGSQLSARRILHDTKARPALQDMANIHVGSSTQFPTSNGYLRSPSPYSLASTPSPPSLPDTSGVDDEDLTRRSDRSRLAPTPSSSRIRRKVSDWLGEGDGAPDLEGRGGETPEDHDRWVLEVERSMSPLERELRGVEEYCRGIETCQELPVPLVGEGGGDLALEEGGAPGLGHSHHRSKRLRMMEPSDDSEAMDTVFDGLGTSGVGVSGEDGGGRVLTRAPAGPHVSITGTNGRRVYLKMTTLAEEKGKNKAWSSSHHLLPVQFTRLRQMVEEEKRRRLIEQSNQLLQSLHEEMGESEPLFESEDPVRPGEEKEEESNRSTLWVEKYSPKNYTELLSDDGINRTLLSWLKLWDEVVFGRKAVLHEKPEDKKKGEEKRGWRGDKKADMKDPSDFSVPEALDESRRPQMKIALLCGAPGLGKTTLAHVIAQHAGYNVVEMNASDDRSPEMFRNNIEASTQMQAVLTSHSKPNCLIIDEIDGAPTAAISVLIDLIKKKEGGGKKKKRDVVLLRPIICICNDQYAPSLRQLRQHALILYFPPTASARLAARLQQIAKREHMSAAISALMALCEKSENDIRSCLNTLQFIHKKQKELTLAAVQSVTVGQKDVQRSLFSLWKEVFQLSSAGKRHTLNTGPLKLSRMEEMVGLSASASGGGGSSPGDKARQIHKVIRLAANVFLEDPLMVFKDASKLLVQNAGSGEERSLSASASRFHQMLSATMATGEYEKVVQGLFENYLLMRFRDPNMKNITLGQEWLVFHDIVQRHISQCQDYLFVRYQPFLPVAFHFLFSSLAKPQIKYPHSDFEAFQHHQQNQHLITSLVTELPPSIKQYITSTLLSVDLLSPFLEIISPIFRPVSIQLYSAREKQQLTDLVNTMISCGVTYRQEKGPDGQYTYILDPNIEQLCRFPGLPQKRQLSYSAKQMISREIELEKLRRAEKVQTMNEVNTTAPNTAALGALNTAAASAAAGTKATIQSLSASKSVSTAILQSETDEVKPAKHLTKLKDEKQPMDFFGRVAKSKCVSSGGPSAVNSGSTHPLWFKYNEGYSNAVRRPVRVQDLL